MISDLCTDRLLFMELLLDEAGDFYRIEFGTIHDLPWTECR